MRKTDFGAQLGIAVAGVTTIAGGRTRAQEAAQSLDQLTAPIFGALLKEAGAGSARTPLTELLAQHAAAGPVGRLVEATATRNLTRQGPAQSANIL